MSLIVYNHVPPVQLTPKVKDKPPEKQQATSIEISILGRGEMLTKKLCGSTDVCCINKYLDIVKGLVPILIFHPPSLGSGSACIKEPFGTPVISSPLHALLRQRLNCLLHIVVGQSQVLCILCQKMEREGTEKSWRTLPGCAVERIVKGPLLN